MGSSLLTIHRIFIAVLLKLLMLPPSVYNVVLAMSACHVPICVHYDLIFVFLSSFHFSS